MPAERRPWWTCRWCYGRGCVACPPPPAPEPAPELLLAVPADPEADPEGWRVLREALGKEAVEKAFGPGGGGIEEIRANVARSSKLPGAEEG